MNGKKATIKIATPEYLVSGEKEEVEATVYGDFAIHPPRRWTGNKYSLTHVKSGYRIPQRLRYKYQIEGLIATLSDLDWDFTDGTLMPEETKKEAQQRSRQFHKLSKEEQRQWSYKLARPAAKGEV
jgi:hypothetical protein